LVEFGQKKNPLPLPAVGFWKIVSVFVPIFLSPAGEARPLDGTTKTNGTYELAHCRVSSGRFHRGGIVQHLDCETVS
jgi:hypothetical protein